MTSLSISIRGDDIARVFNAAAANAPVVLASVVNITADVTRKAMVPVLTHQTALPERTIHRALKLTPATGATLTAKISSAGGNISLKYFAPTETAGGVSAAPHGQRRVYAGTFMRAGWWPNRVDKPKWHGQVFRRAGGKTRTGMDRFQKVKSDEFIPTEMVTGASAATFKATSEAHLGLAVDRAIAGLLSDA